jgi:hypothetical protein
LFVAPTWSIAARAQCFLFTSSQRTPFVVDAAYARHTCGPDPRSPANAVRFARDEEAVCGSRTTARQARTATTRRGGRVDISSCVLDPTAGLLEPGPVENDPAQHVRCDQDVRVPLR